jgi:hypothetical protein
MKSITATAVAVTRIAPGLSFRKKRSSKAPTAGM